MSSVLLTVSAVMRTPCNMPELPPAAPPAPPASNRLPPPPRTSGVLPACAPGAAELAAVPELLSPKPPPPCERDPKPLDWLFPPAPKRLLGLLELLALEEA